MNESIKKENLLFKSFILGLICNTALAWQYCFLEPFVRTYINLVYLKDKLTIAVFIGLDNILRYCYVMSFIKSLYYHSLKLDPI